MDDGENGAPPTGQNVDDKAVERVREEARKTLEHIHGDKGVLGLFSFEKMYFPFFARVLYIVYCIGIVVVGLVFAFWAILTMINREFLYGLAGLGMVVVGGIAAIILGRIWIEFVMVAFSINDTVRDIRNLLREKMQ